MSIDFGAWLSRSSEWVPSQIALRAQVQWARILDKQFDLTLQRNGVALEPQTVRVELDNAVTEEIGESGNSSMRRAMVFGIHGHPDLDDTDIKVWDVFVMDDMEYTVVTVNRLAHGQVQAYCEAVG
jgi:hypothetical protein